MSRSRPPKCHSGRGCGVCPSSEKVYALDALNELVAETERLGLYDDEAKMMDDADMRATRDKRVIIERIYAAWCKVPHLRLGQFLWQSIFRKQSYGLFNVPDLYLCDMCEYTVKEHKLAEVDQ